MWCRAQICLICLMGVIGSRMDVYAAVYAGWLLALVSCARARLARVWPAFTACLTVLVPLQYMLSVGFLPQLCLQFPWSGETQVGINPFLSLFPSLPIFLSSSLPITKRLNDP